MAGTDKCFLKEVFNKKSFQKYLFDLWTKTSSQFYGLYYAILVNYTRTIICNIVVLTMLLNLLCNYVIMIYRAAMIERLKRMENTDGCPM